MCGAWRFIAWVRVGAAHTRVLVGSCYRRIVGAGRTLFNQVLGTGSRPAKFIRQSLAAPLDAVRDYFGTKLSFYFAFLGFYTINLVRPALYGLAVHVIRVVGLGGDSHVQGLTASDWVLVGSVYVVCAWRSVAVLMVHARDCGVSVCVSVCMCVSAWLCVRRPLPGMRST